MSTRAVPTCSSRVTDLRKSCTALSLATLLLFAGVAPAQQPAPPGEPRSDVPAAVLRVTTRLVLVDVVVTDKDNRPVTGLTRDDFILLENGKPQTIATFSFESPAVRAAGQPAPPPLPENVYTNRPEYRMPPGPLTILLLDALNTPASDQSFARQKMLEYLDTQLLPNQRTAILALVNNIFVLQDFTTDPALLKAAVHKHLPQTSGALAREEGAPEIPSVIADVMREEAAEAIQRFSDEQTAVAVDTRVKTTLAALRVIARAVSGYPGRKNLVWVSAAFPFSFIPEESDNYDLLRFYADDIRRTASSLTDAQVAVYPVDARGLVGAIGAQLPTALESGRRGDRVALGRNAGIAMDNRIRPMLDSQHTMKQIADATGGRAFLNRNDIDKAVTLSVEDGSTYYTLGYYPEDKSWDGKFRKLQVKLNRQEARARYRRGYYAIDPTESLRGEARKKKKGETASDGEDVEERKAELRAALSNPLPATAVTFRVGVPPPAPAAGGNSARVECRFLVDAHTISLTEAQGMHTSDLDFLVVAFNPEGKGVTSSYQTVETQLEAERFEWVKQNGLPYTLGIELAPGRYQLRMIVRDNRTGLVGTADAGVIIEEAK